MDTLVKDNRAVAEVAAQELFAVVMDYITATISEKVEAEVQKTLKIEIESKVEAALDGYDPTEHWRFDQAVNSVVDDYDFSDKVSEGIDDYDFSDKVDDAISDAKKDIVREIGKKLSEAFDV